MPFRSEAQRRYLWMYEPEVARRWATKYGTPSKLPYHVKRGEGARLLKLARRRKHIRESLKENPYD